MIEIKAIATNEGVQVRSKIEGKGEEVLYEATALTSALLKELWSEDETLSATIMLNIIETMKKLTGYTQSVPFDPISKINKQGKEFS